MRIASTVLVGAVAIACLLVAGGCSGQQIGPEVRRAWIAKTLAHLRTFKPSADTWRAERSIDKETGCVTYTLSRDGLVPIGRDGWIYIAAHSMHQEDGIGDAILAVDHTGQLYANDGHVCQQMRFPTKSRKGFRTVEELLQVKDQPNWAWRKLKK